MPQDTDHVIERIYDTVDDVGALPDVLSGLCERIGGENGILSIVPKRPGPLAFASLFRLDPEFMPILNDRHVRNVWTKRMVTQPVGMPIASDAFAPFDQLKRTDF